MKTEISRDNDRPDRDYSGVFQQQGRMLTDADWNELVSILLRQLSDTLTDIIGSGAPAEIGAQLAADYELVPGPVYADGRRARLRADDANTNDGSEAFAYEVQRYPAPSLPDAPRPSLRFYADVWDRTVTVLEDAQLLDTALRGADTCSRSQRLVQVKWCSDAVEVAQLPKRGSARLSLVAPAVDDESASAVSTELEPHLFRVEVHDVSGDGTRVTLKWSAENGALAHASDDQHQPPPTFLDDRHIYEYFSTDDEQQLGHVRPEWGASFPSRGELSRWTPTSEPPAGKHFVRRWDGCCTLRVGASGWELDPTPIAFDGATDLVGSEALEIDAGSLRLTLEHYVLTLELQDRDFLVGDHWLVAIRELPRTGEDAPPFADAQLPSGVVHAYFELGTLDADGELVPATVAEQHARAFTTLTGLRRAIDVSYDSAPQHARWAQDGDQPDNVQDALDTLVEAKVSRSGDSIHGTLVVEANLIVGDDAATSIPADEKLTVIGDARVTDRLTTGLLHAQLGAEVGGNVNIHGSTRIGASLQVRENVFLGEEDDHRVTIHGVVSSAHSSDALQIDDDVTIHGTLINDGPLTIGDDTQVRGSLRVGNNLTVDGDLLVRGETIEVSSERVRGDVTLGDEDSDTVTIHGRVISAHSSGILYISNSTEIRGQVKADSLEVSSAQITDHLEARTSACERLTVMDRARVGNGLDVQAELRCDRLEVDADAQINGSLGVADTTTSTRVHTDVVRFADGTELTTAAIGANIPSGIIVMWSGAPDKVPAGWALCDGGRGTPDLRDRFILGSGGAAPSGAQGGRRSVTLGTQHMPAHNHRVTVEHHGHNSLPGSSFIGTNNYASMSSGTYQTQHQTSTEGNGQGFEIIPPFYALAFIIKL